MGEQGYGIDTKRLGEYASQIKEIAQSGVEVAIVIGGGNIFRGLSGASKGFDRVKGDQMGMLATVINSLALSSALEAAGQPARVFTAINMFPIGEHYSKWKAIEALKGGAVAYDHLDYAPLTQIPTLICLDLANHRNVDAALCTAILENAPDLQYLRIDRTPAARELPEPDGLLFYGNAY